MKTLTGIALAALTAGVALSAPAAAQVRSEIELTRQQIQTERQALVAAGMELTDEQAAKFWPVYREYRAELAPIGDRQVELIMGYADKYGSVDDDYAQEMLNEFLNIKQAQLEVLRKYVPKFLAVLPAVKVARFYQIENKLDAVVAFDLAASIPVLQ
jgi:Spy/CpxP family protein refolding chaperone